MPRTRRAQLETAYQRRIRRGMERGLTRQEARGHRPPKRGTEASSRIKRYLERYPEASRKEAAGKDPEAAKERRETEAAIKDFLDYIEDGDIVSLVDHVSTITRQPDGRWEPHWKRVLPVKGEERDVGEFLIPAITNARLSRLIDQEIDKGADLTPMPSLDQRSMQTRPDLA